MFFKWVRRSKSILILIYGLGTAFMVINAIISIALFDVVLEEKPTVIMPDSDVLFPGFEDGTIMSMVFSFQSYSNISYYILMWIGTVILLRYKIKKIGSLKFYVLSILPLIYFMSYYATIYDQINPEKPVAASVDLTGLILFFGYATMGGGIIVAFGFREISKIVMDEKIRNYIIMTSLGFVLYFICGSASIGQAPYPPFGLISISMLGLGSFLILSGLYLSAMYMTTDRNLRGIVKSAIDASRLLENIGSAQFNIEMEKVTIKVMEEKNNMQTPLAKSNFEAEEEVKNYIEEVLTELQRAKNT